MAESPQPSTAWPVSSVPPKLAAHLMMFASADTLPALRFAVRKIARCGLNGVEIPITADLIDLSPEVADQARELGLGVIASTVLPRDGDIGSQSQEDRRRGLDFLRRAIDVAAVLGSPVLGGLIQQPSRTFPGDARTHQRWANMVAGLKEAAIYADLAGIQLAVEPTTRFVSSEINTVQEALDLRHDVGASLGLVLDTYHLAAEEADLVDAVARGLSAAAYIQVNESTRGIFGEGVIDWSRFAQVLRAFGYQGWLSFEAFPRSSAWATRAFSWRSLGTASEIVASGIAALGLPPRTT